MSVVKKQSESKRGSLPRSDRRSAAPALSRSAFWATTRLETLASEQGVEAIEHLDELCSDFWPARESADEFISEIKRLRQQDTTRELP